jgi:DNA (cytosine-5)-methyltransferase 1
MRVLDLFAGIGGFTLGLERAGFETVAFCEIEPYAQKVLHKNWPGVKLYDDVRGITAERLAADGIGVDVITGGFPCQDISVAGKGAGIEGERSGLWSECARLIGELRPRYAIFENVTNLLNGERGDWFKRVLWDISALGYDAEWHCIPASSIGAHHRRDRVWIVAYPNGDDGRRGDCTQSFGRESRLESWCSGEGQSFARASEDVADTNCGDNTRVDASASERGGEITSKGAEHAGRGGCDQNVADTNCKRGCGGDSERQNAKDARQSPILTRRHARRMGAWDVEPDVGRVANGVPSRSHRLKCLGNAVVPQIPELIGRAIMEAENDYHRV